VSRAGALLAARFSFMPNRLGYCGPEENRAMLDYLAEQHSDRGLEHILSRFAGAFPYYSFIAASNGIRDPFDERVIEAYWVGNSLLEQVRLEDFQAHLTQRFERRVPTRLLRTVLAPVPAGARPHHNFHVLNMSVRTGHPETPHTVAAIDECRVSWGRVVAADGDHLLVERRPLVRSGDDLVLGPGAPRRVLRRFDGKTLLANAAVGDVVALHWGCACLRLSARRVRALMHYTAYHLALINRDRRTAALSDR
jgi:hypothetical protein